MYRRLCTWPVCINSPVHPSLARVIHLLHLPFSLELSGVGMSVFLHCLVEQTPDKSPGFEMLSQHQGLLIAGVNNGTETQDCWVLFLALHLPSCENLDSISLSSGKLPLQQLQVQLTGSCEAWIVFYKSLFNSLNPCKGARCNEWMIIEYLIKTAVLFLAPGGRNISVCTNHSH